MSRNLDPQFSTVTTKTAVPAAQPDLQVPNQPALAVPMAAVPPGAAVPVGGPAVRAAPRAPPPPPNIGPRRREQREEWKQRRLAPLDDEVRGNECFSKLLKECFKREDNGQEVEVPEVRYCSVCELYYNSGRKKTWDLVANKSALESHVSTDPVHIRRKTHAEQLWRKGHVTGHRGIQT
eukprot:COSAG03_NODE_3287_length_2100_cov_1.903548_1_plen_179_part_00